MKFCREWWVMMARLLERWNEHELMHDWFTRSKRSDFDILLSPLRTDFETLHIRFFFAVIISSIRAKTERSVRCGTSAITAITLWVRFLKEQLPSFNTLRFHWGQLNYQKGLLWFWRVVFFFSGTCRIQLRLSERGASLSWRADYDPEGRHCGSYLASNQGGPVHSVWSQRGGLLPGEQMPLVSSAGFICM